MAGVPTLAVGHKFAAKAERKEKPTVDLLWKMPHTDTPEMHVYNEVHDRRIRMCHRKQFASSGPQRYSGRYSHRAMGHFQQFVCFVAARVRQPITSQPAGRASSGRNYAHSRELDRNWSSGPPSSIAWWDVQVLNATSFHWRWFVYSGEGELIHLS